MRPGSAAAVGVLLRPASRRRCTICSTRPRPSALPCSTPSSPTTSGSTASYTADPAAGTGVPRPHTGRRARRRDGQVAGGAVRGRASRRGLAQGQAGAHARPGRARGRVGLGTPTRQAVEHPPRRARSGDRWLRHARQDVQGDDRRDTRTGRPNASGTRGRPYRRIHRTSTAPSRSSRSRSTASRTSTRYPGGMALRFARVVRYRDDKSADEADTVSTLRDLYERDN